MKSKFFLITVGFCGVIILLTCFFYFKEPASSNQNDNLQHIVAINEIEQLIALGDTKSVQVKLSDLEKSIRSTDIVTKSNNYILLIGGACLMSILSVFLYIYFAVLRPFDKLKGFAESIAQGNFDVPLKYERSNYFGKFTWAFDSMRNEITNLREREKQAIENNKTVIATLSHDIKAPIASIRTYTEGLQANMDSTPEKRAKYLSVIIRKCDEVSKLTNDLFLHSLSDLDKIKVNTESFELCNFIETVVTEIAGEYSGVNFERPDFKAIVSVDKNRLTQIIENLITNSRKYAKTNIDVKLSHTDGNVNIHFIDYGNGIPDSDMPFIFDKFYRGKNSGDEQGSGLGLYIVKYLAEKMGGKVLLHNHTNSFEAVISLPIK